MSSKELETKIRKLFEDLNLQIKKQSYDYSTPPVDNTEETITKLVLRYKKCLNEKILDAKQKQIELQTKIDELINNN